LFVGDLRGSWVLFKSITARELFKKFPEIKKRFGAANLERWGIY
jgi:hypothetical protein